MRFKLPKTLPRVVSLDFVEGDNIHRLDIVFKSNNLLLKIVHHDFVVFNDASDLELLDTVAESTSLFFV